MPSQPRRTVLNPVETEFQWGLRDQFSDFNLVDRPEAEAQLNCNCAILIRRSLSKCIKGLPRLELAREPSVFRFPRDSECAIDITVCSHLQPTTCSTRQVLVSVVLGGLQPDPTFDRCFSIKDASQADCVKPSCSFNIG